MVVPSLCFIFTADTIFLDQFQGVVGELGLAQVRLSQVLFAIDKFAVGKKRTAELPVDQYRWS